MNNAKINSLPILKHFETDDIGKSVDSFRKGFIGEKGLFRFFKLAVLGVVLYFSWVYILPPLFIALGQVIAIGGTIVAIVALIILAPVIIKGIRRFTRLVHKALIKHDPFAELENQKAKMLQNKVTFQKSKGKISALKNDMEVSAAESEDEAKELEKAITSLHTKATKIKVEIDGLVEQHGAKAKGMDEYVNLRVELQNVVSKADRLGHKLEQAKDHTRKYATRGAVMKKFSQKLRMVESSMNIKIDDFDATIDILKKDYAFAQKSREATDSAKSAMLFTEGWELEYALDVVTTTIAEDIAITAANFNDIEMLTSNYSYDSDELYDKLDLLADDIRVGRDPVVTAKDYTNPEYKFTHEDRVKSGGFDELLNN